MYTLEELQPKIIEWANNKDLVKLKNAPKQRLKLIEELGELASAVLKNNIKEQKDAIGDSFVVITILAEQIKSPISFYFHQNYKIQIEVGIEDILRFSFKDDLSLIMSYVNDVAFSLGLDLTECANIAWNEIKDRTGETKNGTFIKN